MTGLLSRRMCTRTAAAVFASAATILIAIYSPSEASASTQRCIGLGIGTNYQWSSTAADARQDLPKIKKDGIGSVREDIFWSVVQPTSRHAWNWAPYDQLFSTTTRLHEHVLPIASYGTAWASPGGQIRDIPRTRSGQQAYARFAAAIVQRYGPRGTFWRNHRSLGEPMPIRAVELWNEPWYSPNPALEPYVDIVRDAGAAIHRISPETLIVANADDRAYALVHHNYLIWGQQLLNHWPELKGYVNRWAIHPYSAGQWTGLSPAADSMRQIRWLQAELTSHHATGLIWITELGFSSARPPRTSAGYRTYQAPTTAYEDFGRAVARTSGPHRVSRMWLFTAARPDAFTRPGSWDYGFNLISRNGVLAEPLRDIRSATCVS